MSGGKTKLELVLEAVDRVTGPLQKIERQIAMLEHASARSADRMTGWGAQGAKAMRDIAAASAVAAGAVALVGKEVIQSAAKFETALTGIQKKAGTTAEQTAAIGENIKALGTSGQVASSLYDLAAAYDAGAGAGIPLDQLEQYALLTAKGADAFEMSNEAMGEFMGNLRFGMGQTNAEIVKTLDVINALADAGKAAESGIAMFVSDSGAQLKGLKFTQGEIAALGTTFLNIGVQQDVASTFTSAFATKLSTVGSLSGKGRKTFEKYMGSVKGFAKLVAKDGNAAMLTMIDRMSKLTDAEQAELGLSFVGLEHVDTFKRLVAASAEYRRNLELAGDETKWLGSLDKSYELKMKTFDAQWQMVANSFEVLKINVGTMILPSVKAGLEQVRAYVKDFDVGLKLFPAMLDRKAVDEALASVSTVMGAVERLLGMDPTSSTLAGGFRQLAQMVNQLAEAINGIPKAIERVTNPEKSMKLAQPGPDGEYEAFKERVRADYEKRQWMKSMPAMGFVPDSLIGDKPSTFAMNDYEAKNWDRALVEIKLTKSLETEGAAVVRKAAEIGQSMMDKLGITATPIVSTLSILDATGAVRSLDTALRGLPNVSVGAPAAVAPKVATIAVDGARALGGPVASGGAYLVGERGPELFTPGRSGMIHTAGRTSRLFAGARAQAGTGGSGGGSGSITIHAPLTMGDVRFASAEDKEEFETKLRRHARTISEVVESQTRRQSRVAF